MPHKFDPLLLSKFQILLKTCHKKIPNSRERKFAQKNVQRNAQIAWKQIATKF